MNKQIFETVKQADHAINSENLDDLMNFYSKDAVLVVKPGLLATGRKQIREAFISILEYFNHSLQVNQDKMAIIESGDTALVIAKAELSSNKRDSDFSTERISTYVFRKNENDEWLCVIDNSYGAELLEDRGV